MNIFKILLLPLSLLFGCIVWLRNLLYDLKILKSYKVSLPVISVGNISVGGSGKTPYVLKLCEELKRHGKKPAVICRGYKRQSHEAIEKVDITKHNSLYFGDEASLLAFRANVPVYVGSDRVAVAKKLIAQENVDVILLDDGFQHRRIHRDLDLVIFDATQTDYTLLPAGRSREPMSHIQRADLIALHKMNLAKDMSFWKDIPRDVESSIEFLGLVKLSDWQNKTLTIANLDSSEYNLVCGVAKPEQVLVTIQKKYPDKKFHVKAFSDHHIFADEDLPKSRMIITEKDAIKIKDLNVNKNETYVMVNDLNWNLNYDKWISKIFTTTK
jgi:tetraacyldisaccharide 4'-kinase